MNQELHQNLTSRNMWKRGLYMLVYVLALSVASTVLSAVVLVQFGIALVTGRPNEALAAFGGELGQYVCDVVLFLTFHSERRPFPFHDEPVATRRNDDGHADRGGSIPRASLLSDR